MDKYVREREREGGESGEGARQKEGEWERNKGWAMDKLVTGGHIPG